MLPKEQQFAYKNDNCRTSQLHTIHSPNQTQNQNQFEPYKRLGINYGSYFQNPNNFKRKLYMACENPIIKMQSPHQLKTNPKPNPKSKP